MAFLASGGGTGTEWRTAPNATNYIDLLEKVRALALSANEGVTAVGTIQAGGSGYAVGDFVRVADGNGDAAGTAAHPSALSGATAVMEVTAVSSGAVTALRLRTSGCYSTNPANNGTAGEYDTVALTGSGDDALTVDLTFDSPGWTEERITQEVDTVAIGANDGTNYTAGADVEVVGGDTRTGFTAPQSDNPASFNVDTVSSGNVTALSILNRGIYHRNPGVDEVATNVIAGSGDDDLTVDLTFRDFTDTTTDRELILTSPDGFHVGMRTFTNGSTVANWEIMGMQEYVSGNDWDAQTTQSRGRYPENDASITGANPGGCYFVLENEAFNYWVSVTSRRIVVIAQLASGIYSNMWLGAFDNFGTAAQYPAPLAAIGNASHKSVTQGTSESRWCGMNLCIAADASHSYGPAEILTPGAGWVTARNAEGNNNNTNISNTTAYEFCKIIPGGDFDTIGSAFDNPDEFMGDEAQSSLQPRWAYWCFALEPTSGGGIEGEANTFRWDTMGVDGGDEIPAMFEITLVEVSGTSPQVLGELGGVKYVDQRIDGGGGFLNDEDELDDGTDYWYVFRNSRLDRHWSHFVMQGV